MNLEARTAIEALRAGVPNRAAVRLMHIEQTSLEQAFADELQAAWAEPGQPRNGLGIAGGFGAGKSHFLGYLAEQARAAAAVEECMDAADDVAVCAGERGLHRERFLARKHAFLPAEFGLEFVLLLGVVELFVRIENM
jgi:predicted ATPase